MNCFIVFKIIRNIFTVIFTVLFFNQTWATHIVGGAFDYQKIADSTYIVTLKLYRDCGKDTFHLDLPSFATARIRGPFGGVMEYDQSLPRISIRELDPVVDTCVVKPGICVEEGIYQDTIFGIDPAFGYHVYFQTCCRNWSITNITLPLDAGESFYTYIPPETHQTETLLERSIWHEDFNLTNGDTIDNGPTAWSTSHSAPSTIVHGVENGLYKLSRAQQNDYWLTTDTIDISSYPSVDLLINFLEEGPLDVVPPNNDYIRFYYNLDGSATDVAFETNGDNLGNFDALFASHKNISGSKLVIKILMRCTGSNEEYLIDNIFVLRPSTSTSSITSNSSPVFTNFPPIFVCADTTLVFDNSATDADGDSLVYSFYDPFDAKLNTSPLYPDYVPKYSENDSIIFQTVNWVNGYNASNALGTGATSLDRHTGMLTINPSTLGQFVVGVRVDEYRDGILIGYTVRDFQFNVIYCPPVALSIIEDSINCNSKELFFQSQESAKYGYSWDFGDTNITSDISTDQNPSYTYTEGGDYTITLITNPGTKCADTSYKNIQVKTLEANFEHTTPHCKEDLITFSDSSTSSSNNSITSWNWDFGNQTNASSQNSQLVYDSVGTFEISLIITDPDGCKDTATQSLETHPNPKVSLIDDFNLCRNAEEVVLNSNAENYSSVRWSRIGGYGSFTSSFSTNTRFRLNSLNTTFNVSEITFVIEANSDFCATVYDSVKATFVDPPIAVPQPDSVMCFDYDSIEITSMATDGTLPYTYAWSTLDSTQNIFVDQGTYWFEITDANGCKTDQDTIVVTKIPQPTTIDIIPDTTICFEDLPFNASLSFSNAPGFDWIVSGSANPNLNSTSIQYSPSASEINNLSFTLFAQTQVDTLNCPIKTDSITVGIGRISLSIDSVIPDCDSLNGVGFVSASNGSSPYNYQWGNSSNNQTTDSATQLAPTWHYITVTDQIGCSTIDSINLENNQPTLSITDTTHVNCFNETSGAATVSAMGGSLPYQYNWDAQTQNQTGQTASNLGIGIYRVTLTDGVGCRVSIPVEILDLSGGQIFTVVSNDDTLCPNDSYNLTASASGGNGGPYTYDWNNGWGSGENINVTVSNSTLYQVVAYDKDGCPSLPDSVYLNVRVFNPDSLLIDAENVCQGSTSNIEASYQGTLGPYTYTWNNGLPSGNGPHSVTILDTTIYSVTVTDQCNNQVVNQRTIFAYPYPTIRNNGLLSGCQPFSLSLSDSATNPDVDFYQWEMGDGTTYNTPSINHTYNEANTFVIQLSMASIYGCTTNFDTTALVTVHPKPQANCSATPIITDTDNPDVTFTTDFYSSYFWDFGDLSTQADTSISKTDVYTYQDTGNYLAQVYVATEFNCKDTCEVIVRVNPAISIKTPNVFTPNPNGPNGGVYDKTNPSNEVFFPFTDYVTEFHMLIFSRWGEIMFETFDINIGWDGYYKGKLAQQDTYMWKIKATFIDGQQKTLTGDVTLVR